MNAITDQTLPWLIAIVAVGAAATAVILVALAVFVPPLWRAGLAWMRELLARRDR